VQIKGPDGYSHRGDFIGKIKSIQEIDQKFLRPLLFDISKLPQATKLIITCDHVTSSIHRSHYKGNVTFIQTTINEKVKICKARLKFSERLCKNKKIIKHLPL